MTTETSRVGRGAGVSRAPDNQEEIESTRRMLASTRPEAVAAFDRSVESARRRAEDSNLAVLPPPNLDGARAASGLASIHSGGDLLEQVASILSQGRRTEVGAGEASQRARAASVDAQQELQRAAMERAREAAEDASFWDTFGEVAAWVGAAVSVVAAVPTGGATLALAGVAAAAVLGSQYADDIAGAMADAGMIDASAVDDWTMGLSIGCAVVALACGIGAAVAGAGAAASELSSIERGVRTAAQIGQATAAAGQGVATGGRAVCGNDEARARIEAEQAEHQSEVSQERREELIELIQAAAQGWCRELARMGEMIRTVHTTSSQALVSARA